MENGYTIENTSKTRRIQLEFPVETYLERRKMSANITIKDTLAGEQPVRFAIGYADSNDHFGDTELRITGQQFELVEIHRGIDSIAYCDTLKDIHICAGGSYTLTVDKQPDAVTFSISDGASSYAKKIGKPNGGMLSLCWGNAYVGSYNGKFEVKEITLSAAYYSKCKVGIWGDSLYRRQHYGNIRATKQILRLAGKGYRHEARSHFWKRRRAPVTHMAEQLCHRKRLVQARLRCDSAGHKQL
jgi:hypothetical protein